MLRQNLTSRLSLSSFGSRICPSNVQAQKFSFFFHCLFKISNPLQVDQGLMLNRLGLIDTTTLLIYNGNDTQFELLSVSSPPHPLSLCHALPFRVLCRAPRVPVCARPERSVFQAPPAASSAALPGSGVRKQVSWQRVSWLHLLLFPWVDSLSQALPAFPMKDSLLSEEVTAPEGSVWKNGGKSPHYPGKMENNTSLLSLRCSRKLCIHIYTHIYMFYVKSLGEWQKLLE